MKILNVTRLILAMTIIALGGIVVTAGAPSLFVQLASATDVTTVTMGGQGGGGVATTDRTTATNNVSNAVLGSLFLTGEDKLISFNPINETYTEVSYVGNRTIMPIDGIAAATITARETGNLTLKLQSNGITFVEGQSLLVTQGGGGNNSGGAEQQENATALLVDLNGIRPDDPRSSTGVAFFSTNSTGQLAFLDNIIAIYQVKTSPEGTAIQMWEWKGADLPFEDDDDEGGTATTPEEPASMNTTMTNATTSADTNAMAASEEEGEGNEEGEDPNEFENCVVPPGRDPSDVGC
jgi:hypothetical protein